MEKTKHPLLQKDYGQVVSVIAVVAVVVVVAATDIVVFFEGGVRCYRCCYCC